MALNFDTRTVQAQLSESERRAWFDTNWGKIESIIFNTMTIGIREITEDNAEKFYTRYVMAYRAQGWDLFYDLEFVKAMVGLKTNASTKTDAAFKKDCMSYLMEYATTTVNHEKVYGSPNKD